MKSIRLSLTILLLIGFYGCQSTQDKILMDQVKAREAARVQLLQRPAAYIIPGGWESFDKGIINDYTKAVSITFTNNSPIDVDEITGSLRYIKSDGSILATVPFKATGALRAGQTSKLSVTANEISGTAKEAKVLVEGVHTIGH